MCGAPASTPTGAPTPTSPAAVCQGALGGRGQRPSRRARQHGPRYGRAQLAPTGSRGDVLPEWEVRTRGDASSGPPHGRGEGEWGGGVRAGAEVGQRGADHGAGSACAGLRDHEGARLAPGAASRGASARQGAGGDGGRGLAVGGGTGMVRGQQDGGGQGAVGARGPATLGEKTRSAVDASGIRGQVGVARRGPTRWTHAVARGASGVLAWWEAITGEGGEVITGGWGLRKGNAKPSSGRGC